MAFLNVSGSVVGDYGRTSVDMVCPGCSKTVKMKVTTANLICPECRHKVSRWRQASQTIILSERDVARILQAVLNTERRTVLGRSVHCLESGAWTLTVERWPVPSRRLMEEIKKLL